MNRKSTTLTHYTP